MKHKKTEQEKKKILIGVAKELYKKGYTTREIGKQIDRSHAWVALVVKK